MKENDIKERILEYIDGGNEIPNITGITEIEIKKILGDFEVSKKNPENIIKEGTKKTLIILLEKGKVANTMGLNNKTVGIEVKKMFC